MRGRKGLVAAAAGLLVLTGCNATTGAADPSGSDAATTSGSASTQPGSTSATTSAAPQSCAAIVADELDTTQKAAQLIMVGMTTSSIGSAQQPITEGTAGSVILLGGWSSPSAVSGATGSLQELVDDGGIGLWVAVDQEGGQIQQVKGSGISTIPSALEQAEMPPAQLQAEAATWASELADLGVHINLAPVADVVPADVGTKNAPIGYYDRQYGATADEATPPMLAFMEGMSDGGLLPTVKHFPGIGRIIGNTDMTAAGIDDQAMTADDPTLATFQAAIDADAPIVMMSTARYPQLDADNQAAFSEPIITDLLRDQMGFDGVVITDDVGAAKSVESVPVAERATRFIEAGGDVVLTAAPQQASTMNDAIVAKYEDDPAFADKVDAAVLRVLELKDTQQLLPCAS